MAALARGPPSLPGSDTTAATFSSQAELRRIIAQGLPSDSDHARADAGEDQEAGGHQSGTRDGGMMDLEEAEEVETLYGDFRHSTARYFVPEVSPYPCEMKDTTDHLAECRKARHEST